MICGRRRANRDLPDHESFMRLWVQHQSRVYAYIRALVFRRADAEDLLQEVAVVLWRKFDQFEPGSRFDQWAYRVARNQIPVLPQKKQRDRLLFSQELDRQHRRPDGIVPSSRWCDTPTRWNPA